MQRIVVAAKAGSEQPWLAQAAAELAGQSKAVVDVVSADGVDIEAFSTVPRAEAAEPAEQAAKRMAEQSARRGSRLPRTRSAARSCAACCCSQRTATPT